MSITKREREGSSPRMRGARLGLFGDGVRLRIIPADAGSTINTLERAAIIKDHPRGCGEHGGGRGRPGIRLGSSPRMRGALDHHSVAMARIRIIPADAGSTLPVRRPGHDHGDHPRGCGEHKRAMLSQMMTEGSSPRMRGAQTKEKKIPWQAGIIPADAGSTWLNLDTEVPEKDHPRGCGEHESVTVCRVPVAGSSPRMRGAQVPSVGLRIAHGIIPADAGSTEWVTGWRETEEDHPRGCGEHLLAASWQSAEGGSSPRMRGALAARKVPTDQQRIIPADAGSTVGLRVVYAHDEDHPRGCGEHAQPTVDFGYGGGSSPRMRGALHQLV